MFITRKSLSRRTVMRSLGAAISLPLLDAMVPAATALAQTAARPRSRLSCIEIVHGCAGSTAHGTAVNLWSPAGEGSNWEFTPILSPLKDFRDYLNHRHPAPTWVARWRRTTMKRAATTCARARPT